MFKSLREKFSSWLKKPEEKPAEVEEIEEVKIPKEKPKKEKKEKTTKKHPKKTTKKKAIKKSLKEEQKSKELVPEKPKEEKSLSVQEEKSSPVQIQEPEEKRGFFSKLFSKKKEEPQETIPVESPKKTEEKKEELEKQLKALQEEIAKKKEKTQVPITSQVQEPIKEIIVEKTIQEPIKIEEEKEGFFSKLARKLSTSTLTQEQFDELFPELEMTLLENNVALEVVDEIHKSLSKDLVGIEVKKSNVESTIINSLKETINSILIEPPNLIEKINKKLTGPFTIIFVGINGSGKTTTIANFAHYLKQNKISCCFAAADTFRAASIEQLKEHAANLNVPIIAHQYGTDPAAVAFDAKKYAESHKIKVVLIDTAGRMYTKTNLIKEMEKIVRVSSPDLKLFIGESITGNDATQQARTFNEAIDIDGIILSKADVDEKAGAILSVSYVTKKPIYFLGTGQSYSDLTPFSKSKVLKNLGLE